MVNSTLAQPLPIGRPGERTAVPDRTVRATVGFASAAMLVSYLPFSAVNGALGTIGASTGAGTGSLQWVTDAFTVALTGAVLFGGAFAERFGRRRIAIAGLLATVVGTLIGWLAGAFHGAGAVHLLWAGQAAAGVGGGLVMSATLSLIALTATSQASRTRSIAIWAGANVAGLGAGPFLAGAISDAAAWRWMFPPVGLLALVTAAFGATRSREVRAGAASSDRAGQLLGTLGVVALVFGVIRGGSAGWASPGALAGLLGGVVLLALFLIVERRAAAPTFPPALFASGGFTASAVAAAAALFTVIGIVFVFSIYLAGRGVNDLGTAERLGCLFAGNAVASVISGPLQTRVGSRPVLPASLAVAAGGLVTLLWAGGPQLGGLSWRLLIVGVGCGAAVACSTAVAVQSAGGPLAAKAGTANNVVRQLGGALGTAVVGGVLAARLSAGASTLDAVHTSIAVLLGVLIAAGIAAAALLARTRP